VRGLIYQWLDRLTRPLTDLYVTVSDDIRRRLLDDGVSRERIEVVPNALALDPETITGDPAWLRETYQLPCRSPVCCAVGRLVPAKGYPTLLDAMARLAEKPIDLHCLIVGSGELHDALKRQIASLGLGQRVRLLGHCDRNDTLRIVKSSDIFVMPSYSEGMPLALLEAAALARPIVATRVGGIPQMLVDGEHALLVEPGDADALAAMLARVCEQTDAARDLGLRAQASIRQRHNVDAQADALAQAYRRALALRRHTVTTANQI
jgi:glycosyltransferase involved in cell wall biosynthesis